MKPAGAIDLHLVPMSRSALNAWIDAYHRHSKPVVGDIIRVGIADSDGYIVGCGCGGRPKARRLQTGTTMEITRIVVKDGIPNGCSMIYGALIRAAKSLGYVRVITYTLVSESGSSLKAVGFKDDGIISPGREWSVPSRPRKAAEFQTGPRRRWSIDLFESKDKKLEFRRENDRSGRIISKPRRYPAVPSA